MAAQKRDFAINYGLKTDYTGSSGGKTLKVDQTNDRVGVGTDNPNTALHIVGEHGIASTLSISASDISADGGAAISLGGEINSSVSNLTSWAEIKGLKDTATQDEDGGYLAFYTKSDGEDITEKFRITSSGESKVTGNLLESTDGSTYWNVVTHEDVGTAPNQIPLVQHLGKLAFLDNLTINATSVAREGAGFDAASTDSGGNLVVGGTAGFVFPSGSTVQRTLTTQGTVRFNTDLVAFEGYNGTGWGKIGAGAHISATPPGNPVAAGDLWWDTVGGRLYVRFVDQDQNAANGEGQWVDASPFGSPSSLILTNGLRVTGGSTSIETPLEILSGSIEKVNVVGTSFSDAFANNLLTGAPCDISDGNIVVFTGSEDSAAANMLINFTGLSSLMQNGEATDFKVIFNANGSNIISQVYVDGSQVSNVYWDSSNSNTAGTSGNKEVYSFNIIKETSTAYSIFASKASHTT